MSSKKAPAKVAVGGSSGVAPSVGGSGGSSGSASELKSSSFSFEVGSVGEMEFISQYEKRLNRRWEDMSPFIDQWVRTVIHGLSIRYVPSNHHDSGNGKCDWASDEAYKSIVDKIQRPDNRVPSSTHTHHTSVSPPLALPHHHRGE